MTENTHQSRGMRAAAQSDSVAVYIGLGSNLGDPDGNLALAREVLRALPRVLGARFSPVYRTEPQGLKEQPFFANQVAELLVTQDCDAPALLRQLQHAENRLGRERAGRPRFGPRIIDLDLLLFGNTRMTEPWLTLPHPRMAERAFVLLPLSDLAPEATLPGAGSAREMLGRLQYRLRGNTIFQD